jgi:hypothetical protein
VAARAAQRRANNRHTHDAGRDARSAQATQGPRTGSTRTDARPGASRTRTRTRTRASTGTGTGTGTGSTRAARSDGANAVNEIDGAFHLLGESSRRNRHQDNSRKNRKTLHGVISVQECSWWIGSTIVAPRKGRFP